jgi:hypothetical protein
MIDQVLVAAYSGYYGIRCVLVLLMCLYVVSVLTPAKIMIQAGRHYHTGLWYVVSRSIPAFWLSYQVWPESIRMRGHCIRRLL